MKIAKEHIVILIIVLVIMLLGVTYGYFFLLVSSEEDSTELYTGTLIANYEQGEIIYDQAFYPRSEPVDMYDLDYAYFNNFTVSNTGTLDGIMQINLYVSKNGFTEGALRYSLYNAAGIRVITGAVPLGERATLLDNVRINSQQTAKYTLVIWLHENGQQQNKNEDQRLTAAVAVDLVQYIE